MAPKAQEPPDPHGSDLRIVKIIESGNTWRTLIICAAVVAGLAIISNAVIKLTEKPPWLVLSLAILVALGVPSPIILKLINNRRQLEKKITTRTKSFELQKDPSRSSSEDGGPPGKRG